jgi:hypothetical protein
MSLLKSVAIVIAGWMMAAAFGGLLDAVARELGW